MPESIGLVPGIFDLFHVGDLDLLAQARGRCSSLVAAVASDALVERVWHRTPFVPQAERMEILAHLDPVDRVVAFEELNLAAEPGLHLTHVFVGGHLLGEDRPALVERMLHRAAEAGLQVVELDRLRTPASRVLRAALGGFDQERRSVA